MAADATGLRVATGRGTLRVTQVQIAGRRAQLAADFVNAHRLEGAVLGT
jgi:methionyl-tRNA formyltransferase